MAAAFRTAEGSAVTERPRAGRTSGTTLRTSPTTSPTPRWRAIGWPTGSPPSRRRRRRRVASTSARSSPRRRSATRSPWRVPPRRSTTSRAGVCAGARRGHRGGRGRGPWHLADDQGADRPVRRRRARARGDLGGRADVPRRPRGVRRAVTSPTAEGRGRPFTMIATHGPRGLALAARYGDAWSTYGGAAAVPLPPDDFWALLADQSEELSRKCAVIGRDPAGVRRSVLLGYGTVQPFEGRLGVRRRGRARGEPGVRRGRRLLERR